MDRRPDARIPAGLRIPIRAKISPIDHPATVGVADFEIFVVGAVTYRCDHLDVQPDPRARGFGDKPGVALLEHRDEIAIGGLNCDRQAANDDRGLAAATLGQARHRVFEVVHEWWRIA